jgi:hypothetical protein
MRGANSKTQANAWVAHPIRLKNAASIETFLLTGFVKSTIRAVNTM